MHIAVKSMSLSSVKDLLLKLEKPAMKYEVASIFLLKSAKFLPAFQLGRENQWRIVIYTGFSSPIFKKLLILPRIIEDFEPKFNRVARLTVIINKSVVGFSLSPLLFFEKFRGIDVKRG